MTMSANEVRLLFLNCTPNSSTQLCAKIAFDNPFCDDASPPVNLVRNAAQKICYTMKETTNIIEKTPRVWRHPKAAGTRDRGQCPCFEKLVERLKIFRSWLRILLEEIVIRHRRFRHRLDWIGPLYPYCLRPSAIAFSHCPGHSGLGPS